LYALGPQEIQVGILKRLPGTPIQRHTDAFDMRYQSSAPYRVLATRDVDFHTVQRMVRFARYWDLVGNSGRFPNTLPMILDDSPFQHFLLVSDQLHATGRQSHGIALKRLFGLLESAMIDGLNLPPDEVERVLDLDKQHNKLKEKVTTTPSAKPANARGNSESPLTAVSTSLRVWQTPDQSHFCASISYCQVNYSPVI